MPVFQQRDVLTRKDVRRSVLFFSMSGSSRSLERVLPLVDKVLAQNQTYCEATPTEQIVMERRAAREAAEEYKRRTIKHSLALSPKADTFARIAGASALAVGAAIVGIAINPLIGLTVGIVAAGAAGYAIRSTVRRARRFYDNLKNSLNDIINKVPKDFFAEWEKSKKEAAGADSSASTIIDCYNILGVQPSASDDEIKQAYRKKAKDIHEENAGKPYPKDQEAQRKWDESMKNLNQAYQRIKKSRGFR